MGADDIMNRMTTLVALYFPEMNDALVEIFEANDAYVSASHNLIVNPSFTTADVNELKENGNRILSEAIGLRVRILGEADALSGKAIPVLLKWWEKKCSAQ